MFDPDEARRLADDLEGRASGSPDPSEFTMRIAKTLRSAIEADDARDHYRRLAERNWESIKEHVADRDRLTAELQAVKDERDGLHRTLKAVVDFAIDECGMPTRYMLGSDAPVRVMRKLKQDRDSYANSDFERQLDFERANLAACREDLAKQRRVIEAQRTLLDAVGYEARRLAICDTCPSNECQIRRKCTSATGCRGLHRLIDTALAAPKEKPDE